MLHRAKRHRGVVHRNRQRSPSSPVQDRLSACVAVAQSEPRLLLILSGNAWQGDVVLAQAIAPNAPICIAGAASWSRFLILSAPYFTLCMSRVQGVRDR